ncbi:MAG: YeeE/YedE family protein [Alphaproteobacteria bacterium]|nr:YeeE/YedE family protein [Alphaproteobacteria bacterium]MCB9931705.1 YeeE/YedE family protein [Alphaproteobacteria bacterium]
MAFDPTAALMGLLGGLLIGASAALLLLANGKIAGISGIVSRTLRAASTDRAETVAFVVGLIAVPALYRGLVAAPAIVVTANAGLVVAGGLLVGFGTVLANGCTSGHGVCGLSRLSVRSLVAVCVFMGVAVLTTALLRPLLLGA